eukprot:5141752-Pyramimonas_sp.AAC.1
MRRPHCAPRAHERGTGSGGRHCARLPRGAANWPEYLRRGRPSQLHPRSVSPGGARLPSS